jgi:hypothetical protein
MYKQISRLTNGKNLPMVAKSADNENVIIERGNDGFQDFFKVTTAQHNGWNRINTYYSDGSADETYSR